MLPAKSDPRWKKLITGETKYNLKSAPAAMCISRIIRETNRDQSADNIEKYIDEAFIFFTKYERVLNEDIKTIFG